MANSWDVTARHGIGEEHDQNAGQRAGVGKCGPKDGPVRAVVNLARGAAASSLCHHPKVVYVQ
jgi:hypothetical protein